MGKLHKIKHLKTDFFMQSLIINNLMVNFFKIYIFIKNNALVIGYFSSLRNFKIWGLFSNFQTAPIHHCYKVNETLEI